MTTTAPPPLGAPTPDLSVQPQMPLPPAPAVPPAPGVVVTPPLTPPPSPSPDHLPPDPGSSAPWGARFRWWGFKYVGTLVLEQNPAGDYVMSLGKFSAAALLAQAMYRWGVEGSDIPQTMLQTLWALLAYALGSRGVNIAHMAINNAAVANQPPNPPSKPVLL